MKNVYSKESDENQTRIITIAKGTSYHSTTGSLLWKYINLTIAENLLKSFLSHFSLVKKSVQANRIYLAVKSLITLYYVIWLAPCGASFVSFSSTNDAKGGIVLKKEIKNFYCKMSHRRIHTSQRRIINRGNP